MSSNAPPITVALALLQLTGASCNPFNLAPRSIDWKGAWADNSGRLHRVAQNVQQAGANAYPSGSYKLPPGFAYPLDRGFKVEQADSGNSDASRRCTITFYLGEGLMDHYSAFIFSNDPTRIQALELKVATRGADFRLERGWYVIND